MLTKKQAWLRVAEMAVIDTVAPDYYHWTAYTGLCEHVWTLRDNNQISKDMARRMVSELRKITGVKSLFIWGYIRDKQHAGFHVYNENGNEDRILGALFMVYSGLTSEDIELLSSNT